MLSSSNKSRSEKNIRSPVKVLGAAGPNGVVSSEVKDTSCSCCDACWVMWVAESKGLIEGTVVGFGLLWGAVYDFGRLWKGFWSSTFTIPLGVPRSEQVESKGRSSASLDASLNWWSSFPLVYIQMDGKMEGMKRLIVDEPCEIRMLWGWVSRRIERSVKKRRPAQW